MIKNKTINAGLWFTVSNFLVKSVGFITTPIFTRMLTKAEFGDYSNFTTWTGILLVIVSLNLGASLLRARFDFKDDLDSYVKSMMMLEIISTTVCYIIAFIIRKPLCKWLSMDFRYLSAMFLYLLFYPVVSIVQDIDRLMYKYKRTVFISVLVALSTSFLSVILVLVMPNRLDGRIIGYVLPVVVIGCVLLLFTLKKKGQIKVSYWKYAFPFTLPYIPHLLSMSLLNSMDRVMIKQFCGSEDLALYSLAYTCASILAILVTSINSAYSPWLGEKLSANKTEDINRISVPYVCFFTYFAVGMMLMIPELLFILGGVPYQEAKYVMPPVAASCIIQLIYCMYVNVEQYEKKTGFMAVASIVAMLSNYVLNSIFIPKYGYIAAAYTTYISYFLLMFFHMVIVRIIGMSNVYRNSSMLIISAGSFIIALLMNYLMERSTMRLSILAGYVVIGCWTLYRNREVILQLLKKEA